MAEPQSLVQQEDEEQRRLSEAVRIGGSFRDPAGFVYERDGELLRQVNATGIAELRALHDSGLYAELSGAGLLVAHEEMPLADADTDEAEAVLKPERVPFISYPYEWCFGQLRDAALATLEIQKRALARGMVLKDASAYNIQFLRGKPILIDSLSLEPYKEGEPWVAYRQFCRHFLAPLALMSWIDPQLAMLQRTSLDGVPLALASKLLPFKTKLSGGLLMHLHMHGKREDQTATETRQNSARVSKTALQALVDSLEKTIQGLAPPGGKTEWADYYQDNSYTPEQMERKRQLAGEMLDSIPAAKTAWDLGANTGEFARIAAAKGLQTVAWDIDSAAVEQGYAIVRREQIPNVLPLRQDLMNPSGNLGWAEHERDSVSARGPADVVMALALVHHLAIANNVPLPQIAEYLSHLGRWVLIEWVPKEDVQVRRLLASRKDVFAHYDQPSFEAALSAFFEVCQVEPILDSGRTLYLLRKGG